MVIILLLILLLAPGASVAHDWFAIECCSSKDCRKLQAGERYRLTPDGDAMVFRLGRWYHVPRQTEELVRVRPSRDANSYLCIPLDQDEPRCVYYATGG